MLEVPYPHDVAMAASPASPPLVARSLATMLDANERRAMQAITGAPRTVRAGTDLVREGDGSDRLLLVTEGWACRYKTTRDGSRQIVALIVPGDFANLDMLLFDRPDYGVRALGEVKVCALSCTAVLALADEHPGIARALTRLAFMENAVLSQQALCLGRRSAVERLAHIVCELAARLDRGSGTSASFDMPLTQEQLADALGLTSVHVNRTLQQLRREGHVETAHRTMTIHDVDRLRSLAGFDPAYLHSRWR